MAFKGLVQDVNLEPHPHPVTELKPFLTFMMDWVSPIVPASLDKPKGFCFCMSVQVRYAHPASEVKDMRSKYLHAWKRRIMNHEELEEKLQAMLQSIQKNAHFVRHSSGLVLADVLTFPFKVCEYLPLAVQQ